MDILLKTTFFNNTVLNYCIFLLSLTVSVAVIMIIEHVLLKRFKLWSENTKTLIDYQFILTLSKKMIPFVYLAALCLSIKILNLYTVLEKIVNTFGIAIAIAIGAILASSLSLFFVDRYMNRRINSANSIIIIKWINKIVEVIIWSVALILFLDNIGIKINSLIAGFGIGGVAIAFAAQSILVDLFCCFTIFFDKPFEIGDFIIVGEQMGTVEYIGMKTTRLRSLNGEQLILSNSDLTNSRISNYKTMEERRVLFSIGVTYDTAVEKLREIPGLIKDIIDSIQDTRFGRAHFCTYSAYSLDFEIAYYILNSDYDKYMDINQEVNFRIKEEFDKQSIEFAFPTQTLQLYNYSKSLPPGDI
ncbi:MAG: mechanosensitive ion channel family protein [Bacillota bacterium]|nr:mechanosensitive ion channel family protein [Bacillota bacterium]